MILNESKLEIIMKIGFVGAMNLQLPPIIKSKSFPRLIKSEKKRNHFLSSLSSISFPLDPLFSVCCNLVTRSLQFATSLQCTLLPSSSPLLLFFFNNNNNINNSSSL